MPEEPVRSKVPVVVCADDFGLENGVDAAIVELAQQGRLSATGCLVQAAGFAAAASLLKPLSIDLGLHLNFTEQLGQSGLRMSLGSLLLCTYLRAISRTAVRQQIETQLDLFERHVGRAPDFIDGHLHVHQFPIIRDILIEVVRRRYVNNLPWVRDTRPLQLSARLPKIQRFKAWLIGALGAADLARLTASAGIHSNQGFAGAYDFDRPHPAYEKMLTAWLEKASPNMLLMVHPAIQASQALAFGPERVQEFQVLSSARFATLLAQQHLQITRLSTLLSRRDHRT